MRSLDVYSGTVIDVGPSESSKSLADAAADAEDADEELPTVSGLPARGERELDADAADDETSESEYLVDPSEASLVEPDVAWADDEEIAEAAASLVSCTTLIVGGLGCETTSSTFVVTVVFGLGREITMEAGSFV